MAVVRVKTKSSTDKKKPKKVERMKKSGILKKPKVSLPTKKTKAR